MDSIKENTIKFIDALIVDNYSKAHKFLEVIVNEKIKQRIAEAIENEHPFKKKKKGDKKKTSKKISKKTSEKSSKDDSKDDSKEKSKKGKFPFFLKKGKNSKKKSK